MKEGEIDYLKNIGDDGAQGAYDKLAFDGTFDCAVFYDSLHYATDESAALHGAYRALLPGGVLVTHEPGEGHSRSADSLRAMELYGVSEKDMPPWHIRELCREMGFSRFEFMPDPTPAIIAMHGINLSTMKQIDRPWWRRAVRIVRLLTDWRLKRGGMCVITK